MDTMDIWESLHDGCHNGYLDVGCCLELRELGHLYGEVTTFLWSDNKHWLGAPQSSCPGSVVYNIHM